MGKKFSFCCCCCSHEYTHSSEDVCLQCLAFWQKCWLGPDKTNAVSKANSHQQIWMLTMGGLSICWLDLEHLACLETRHIVTSWEGVLPVLWCLRRYPRWEGWQLCFTEDSVNLRWFTITCVSLYLEVNGNIFDPVCSLEHVQKLRPIKVHKKLLADGWGSLVSNQGSTLGKIAPGQGGNQNFTQWNDAICSSMDGPKIMTLNK